MWEGETVVRRCDSSQGGVKVVRNLFQLMEWYNGHGGDVRVCGRCDSCQELWQSSMRCEKYRQVRHLMENCDDHEGGEQGLGEV